MAYSAITQPDAYMNGYSFVPLRLTDTNTSSVENYKYVINIVYNEIDVTSSESYNYDGNIYTKLNFGSAHSFKLGDILLLDQASGFYSDYYIVTVIPSTTSVVINLTLGSALTGSTSISNVIKYKLSPDPDYEAKVDLSNTLKDFVTQNLEDSNEIYEGPNTRFEYDLKMGYDGLAVFSFYDNYFQSGYAGFVNSGLTATTQVDFEIGDEIVIQQDLFQWDYTDNYFSGGYVGFTGTTAHGFTTGDTITVTGQITNEYYNGITTVLSDDTYSLVTQKPFLSSSPVEGGSIFGIPAPEYNTSAVITDIVYSAGTGVIIVTDIPWAGSTPAIGGTIKHLDGRSITSLDDLTITGLSVYNSYVTQNSYAIDEFDKYVCQVRTSSANNISTILGNTERYRIEQSTKSWFLAHADGDLGFAFQPRFTFYDVNNNVLSYFTVNNTSGYTDFYFPIGIDQLIENENVTLYSGSYLSAVTNSVNYYKVELERLGSVATNPIYFEINDDCSRYELYHLMWKDARGSWLSYPFKYISRDKTDVDRKNYYQTEGDWSTNSFGFDSFGRGERSFFVRSRDKVSLNSGWITEFENNLIKDLMQSASVYVQTPDNELIAATIDNKTIELGKSINENVWNYSFDVIYSRNNIRL